MRSFVALIVAMMLLLGGTDAGTHPHDLLFVGRRHAANPVNDVVLAVDIATQEIVNPQPFGSYPNKSAPRGLFFKGGDLVVAFQNIDQQPFPGDIIQFDKTTGVFKNILVDHSGAEAPWAPRGMVWIPGNLLVVADIGAGVGYIRIYDYATGAFLRKFTAPVGKINPFWPRGVVYLNGKLYVTSFAGDGTEPGFISRFDPVTGFEDVIATQLTSPNLHRPEGIVVGPDGNLWVASFRFPTDAAPNDVDRILVITPQGANVQEIPLWTGNPSNRVFAQAIVFGPEQELYIGISGPVNGNRGVRKYNLGTGDFSDVVTGFDAWYLAFRKTDPSSLEYRSSN
jgi:hypothetical protein